MVPKKCQNSIMIFQRNFNDIYNPRLPCLTKPLASAADNILMTLPDEMRFAAKLWMGRVIRSASLCLSVCPHRFSQIYIYVIKLF